MKIGLVLSGGAARCISHLGIIKALSEMGIKPHILSGVSGGALFGSGIACGLTAEETLKIVVKMGSIKWFYPSTKSGGLFTFSRIEAILKEQVPLKTFEELPIPFFITATDILKGKPVYFSDGDLIPAIVASCSYPAVFEPVEYRGYTLLDGGIVNNFPVEPIKDKCDKIIGLSTGSTYEIKKISSVQQVFIRTLGLAITEHDQHRFKLCDLVIEPKGLDKFGMFDSGEGNAIFKIGYKYALSKSKEIEKSLL